MSGCAGVPLLAGEPLGELDDELAVGHENGGGDDVEHGMAQRDAEGINGHVVDGQMENGVENEIDRQNNQRTQEVDEGVHDGHALGAGVGAHAGDHRGDACTDVLTHDDGNGHAVGDGAGAGQSLQGCPPTRRRTE